MYVCMYVCTKTTPGLRRKHRFFFNRVTNKRTRFFFTRVNGSKGLLQQNRTRVTGLGVIVKGRW